MKEDTRKKYLKMLLWPLLESKITCHFKDILFFIFCNAFILLYAGELFKCGGGCYLK